MGIWIWILLAWVLTKIALGKRRIGFEHLIWMLLPVDMYGIQVVGVTVKPYMLFCGWLMIRMLLKGNTCFRVVKGWTLPSLVCVVLIFVINTLNNDSFKSLSVPCMLMVVWICTTIYISNCKEDTASSVPEVLIASGIGYGLVFLGGYILHTKEILFPGIVAAERMQPGFILQFSNVFNGVYIQTQRLRGFTIDPNTMLGTFVFSSVVCFLRIIQRKASIHEWMCLVISAMCVLLSNSRMGLLCFLAALVVTVIIGYQNSDIRAKNIIKKIVLVSIPILTIWIVTTDGMQQLINNIAAQYMTRSGLNDEYGRFTIWREAFSILLEKNFLFGIGMSQMQYLTSIQRACHNTWLECICGNGIILGVVLISFLMGTLVKGFVKARRNQQKYKDELLWSMTIGVTIVVISLISVDNLTYSYLWFGLTLLAAVKINTMYEKS